MASKRKHPTPTKRPVKVSRTGKPGATIDAYLARLGQDQRAALSRLRAVIRKTVPGAQECISYAVPAFRIDGDVLVGFGASARHCSFFPMSGRTIADHADLLADYATSKGAIRFTPDAPLPDALVRKLIHARLAELSPTTSSRPNPVAREIYAVVRAIPRGKVATYGQIGELAGIAAGHRVVASAMRTCPDGLPWYRVVGKKDARRAQISVQDPEHVALQRKLLAREGVKFDLGGYIPLKTAGWLPA
ncbi:MAG TPA: DUF1801 domain-containing protein [Polyangiales bacterium]|nr:DUF1801 domain-containing protein [Polyangiales bacterium]